MELHNRDAREDTRDFARLLEEVLDEHAGSETPAAVDELQEHATAYRDGEVDSRAGLHGVLDDLDHEGKSEVARAFTLYFELLNLGEKRQRIREIRRGADEGTLAGSLHAVVEGLAEGASADRMQRVLDDVLVEPTFTAHPTEARRKTVKTKLRAIAGHLEALDQQRLTEKERRRVWRDLEAEVESLWGTPQIRERRPTPKDEARNVLWYLENTLFDVVGEVYDELETELDAAFDEEVSVPKVLEFRSWAGSDRDGNPFVTPETTSEVLAYQREVVLERYRAELDDLANTVSQDGDRVEVDEAFERSLAADADRLPEVVDEVAEWYPNEPYRQKLSVMRERLDRVDDVRPDGYADPGEFADDLAVVAESLRRNGADNTVEAHVEPLRRQVETFGFSLASLDLRDHADRHTAAVTELLGRQGVDYASLDEDGRVDVLTEAVLQDDPVVALDDREGLSETAAEVAELFATLPAWQAEYGTEAIDTYCISMTERASHVLEVLFLADQAGVVDLPGYAGVDVVPLLETESALSGVESIMGTLFENEAYAGALSARDRVQEVMLGYSDSAKENGFLAANWDLDRNQRRLAAIAEEYDVTLRLFHGRGGSISRGGGPMHAALLSLPTETVTGPVKFTEQGEAIAEKYGNPRVAEREVEQMLSAQLRARNRALAGEGTDVAEAWTAAMERAAEAAREEYRDLLETEGFVEYFEHATPIEVIEDLNLGSRPASRSGDRTVEDLRAIPWVFAWTQSRCIVPGWYGLATGLDAYLESGGSLETLREMYREWPFFRTTVDNAAVALATTDLDVAREYADLAPEELRAEFFPRIREEYDRAVELVRAVGEREHVLEREWLRESLARRNPHVDPLNVLQRRLLDRDHLTPTEERTLRLTVKGIAAGMKNTG